MMTYHNIIESPFNGVILHMNFCSIILSLLRQWPNKVLTGTGDECSIPEKTPERRRLSLRGAAGTHIIQSKQWEIAKAYMREGRFLSILFSNGNKLNMLSKARRGKVQVPAPAVIPALLAYIEVDAVKKLVVGNVREWERIFYLMKVKQETTPLH